MNVSTDLGQRANGDIKSGERHTQQGDTGRSRRRGRVVVGGEKVVRTRRREMRQRQRETETERQADIHKDRDTERNEFKDKEKQKIDTGTDTGIKPQREIQGDVKMEAYTPNHRLRESQRQIRKKQYGN